MRTWLTRIAVRTAMRELSKPTHRRVALELVDGVGRDSATDAVVAARRQLERVQEHLGCLPVKQRLSFVLHVVDGRSIEEVAALMSATQTATKSRIFLARRTLVRRAQRDPVLQELMRGGTP